MARPSMWSTEEDRILLETAGHPATEVNRRLVAAGYSHRTPVEIKARRHYIKTDPDSAKVQDPLLERVTHRNRLLRRKEKLLAELEFIEAELITAEVTIREAMGG